MWHLYVRQIWGIQQAWGTRTDSCTTAGQPSSTVCSDIQEAVLVCRESSTAGTGSQSWSTRKHWASFTSRRPGVGRLGTGAGVFPLCSCFPLTQWPLATPVLPRHVPGDHSLTHTQTNSPPVGSVPVSASHAVLLLGH